MKPINQTQISFRSNSVNEGYARAAVAAFLAQLDPTVADLSDIRTVVSEAVTNAIVHGYENAVGPVTLRAGITGRSTLLLEIQDEGKGIEDIERAMEPFYTTQPEQERSGMGFAVMQTFMDDLEVESEPGKGTLVRMRKRIRASVPA